MGERLPCSGGAQASRYHAKGHPLGIQLQNIPIDGAEHIEGEAEAQVGGMKKQRHHQVPAGDWDAGRGRQVGGELA